MKGKSLMWILIMVLLSVSVFASPLEFSGSNNKITFLDASNSIWITDNDFKFTDKVVAFDSEEYTGIFDKPKFWKKVTKTKDKFEYVPYDCKNVTYELNETYQDCKYNKVKIDPELRDVIAEVTLECEQGNWYQIYKYDGFTDDRALIIAEGYEYAQLECLTGSFTFEVDSFSSYTQAQLDALKVGNVLYYSFDEDNTTGTTMIDLSSAENNGTCVGMTNCNTVEGKLLNATDFDGSSDYIVTEHKSDGTLTELTIGGWINIDNYVNNGVIINARDSGNRKFFLNADDDGDATFYIATENGGVSVVTATSTFALDTWYHLIGVYNGTNVILYVDGLENVTLSQTGTVLSSTTFTTLGALAHDYGGKWNGLMDEMGIWNRSLNSTEVLELYNEGIGLNFYTSLPTNLTFTANNIYDDSAITTFNVTIDGTEYTTTNGTIVTTIAPTDNSSYNYNFTAPNYYNQTGSANASTSNTEDVDSYQAILNLVARNKVSDAKVQSPLFNASLQSNNATLYVDAGVIPVSFGKLNWFTDTKDFTTTAQAESTQNFSVYDSNVTFIFNQDVYDNGTLDLVVQNDTYSFREQIDNLTTSVRMNLTTGTYYASIVGDTTLYNTTITVTAGNLTINMTDYGFNTAYFNNNNGTTAIDNGTVLVTYPNNYSINYSTDANGKISFPTTLSGVLQEGNYSMNLTDSQGYVTPVEFIYEANASTLPFNVTYNITNANLLIYFRDGFSSALITENITASITGIGVYSTKTGYLNFTNIFLASDTYNIFTSSENYTYAQKVFTYTNQEELVVTMIMYNKNTADVGTVFIRTYDSFLDKVVGADIRIQEFDPLTSSFTEIGQSTTNSNGEASFQILLGARIYRFLATATIDGLGYTALSSTDGAIIYLDEYLINVYFETITDYTNYSTSGLSTAVYNTTLVDNVSYHQVDFIDENGLDHEICLGYYYIDGVIEKEYVGGTTCVNGSSGSINVVGGKLLNTSYINVVKGYEDKGDYNNYFYIEKYSNVGGFEDQFGDLIMPLIMVGMLFALGLALYMRRVDVFVYVADALSVVWFLVAPSYQSMGALGIMIVGGLMLLYIAKTRNGGQPV